MRDPAEDWRFETVADQLASFLAELGVNPVTMPHAKQGLGLEAAEVKDLAVRRPDRR